MVQTSTTKCTHEEASEAREWRFRVTRNVRKMRWSVFNSFLWMILKIWERKTRGRYDGDFCCSVVLLIRHMTVYCGECIMCRKGAGEWVSETVGRKKRNISNSTEHVIDLRYTWASTEVPASWSHCDRPPCCLCLQPFLPTVFMLQSISAAGVSTVLTVAGLSLGSGWRCRRSKWSLSKVICSWFQSVNGTDWRPCTELNVASWVILASLRCQLWWWTPSFAKMFWCFPKDTFKNLHTFSQNLSNLSNLSNFCYCTHTHTHTRTHTHTLHTYIHTHTQKDQASSWSKVDVDATEEHGW